MDLGKSWSKFVLGLRIGENFSALTRRFILLVLILTGVLCGLIAVVFHDMIELARGLLIGSAMAIPGYLRIPAILLTPTVVAVLLAVILQRYAPRTRGANLARVRRAYAQDPSVLDGKTVLMTLLLTPISLGAGIPLGPEGPTVVVASGASVYLAKLLRLPKKIVRGMIPVGTAAGIAAIFNTPITGVVFALEEVLGTTSRGLLGGTIVAAVAAAVVERLLQGGRPLLPAPMATWHDVRELIGFALVGVVAGLVSGLSTLAVDKLRTKVTKQIQSPIFRAAAGGLAVGLFGLMVPDIFGVGYDMTSGFLHGEQSLGISAAAFAMKTIAFIVSLATGLLGGTFAPSLFIGASLGATVGHLAQMQLNGSIQPGAYALVGMGAFFAGTLRCPIASLLIVFELTGDYGLILPLMLAVALSISISRKLAPLSLTERQLLQEGYREEEHSASDPLATLAVSDVMTRDPVALREDMTLLEAARFVAGTKHHFYPVVNDLRRFVGLLSSDQIDSAAREGTLEERVGDHVEKPPLVSKANESVREMIWSMAQKGVDRCPVVAGDGSGVLVGIVGPADLLHARMKRARQSDTLETELDVLG
ncbi:MAG: chloride channel protein [Thermoanaerobaculia bacterium]